MKIGVKGTEHESKMNLVLNDVKLFLVAFWSDLRKVLRYFGFTESNNSFVLEIAAERHLDESLVGSNTKNSVVVIELSFELLI